MRDLREFIAKLEELGELKVIDKPVHWNQEASGICAMTNRVGGPAVHFKNIKGYPEGYSLLGSSLSGAGTLWPGVKRKPWIRLCIALEIDPETEYAELLNDLISREDHTLHATELSTGPCKEEIQLGSDVDLFKFPFPLLHEGDAGRYSTMHNIMAKDPETGWQDWGASRLMICDSQTLVGSFLPVYPQGTDILYCRGEWLWKIYQKYEAQGEPMPVCVTIGGPPVLYISGLTFQKEGQDRAELSGGLAQSPIDLVKAELSNLMVPAYAEIVIEGEVPPR